MSAHGGQLPQSPGSGRGAAWLALMAFLLQLFLAAVPCPPRGALGHGGRSEAAPAAARRVHEAALCPACRAVTQRDRSTLPRAAVLRPPVPGLVGTTERSITPPPAEAAPRPASARAPPRDGVPAVAA